MYGSFVNNACGLFMVSLKPHRTLIKRFRLLWHELLTSFLCFPIRIGVHNRHRHCIDWSGEFCVYHLIAFSLHRREWRNQHMNNHKTCQSHDFPYLGAKLKLILLSTDRGRHAMSMKTCQTDADCGDWRYSCSFDRFGVGWCSERRATVKHMG